MLYNYDHWKTQAPNDYWYCRICYRRIDNDSCCEHDDYKDEYCPDCCPLCHRQRTVFYLANFVYFIETVEIEFSNIVGQIEISRIDGQINCTRIYRYTKEREKKIMNALKNIGKEDRVNFEFVEGKKK